MQTLKGAPSSLAEHLLFDAPSSVARERELGVSENFSSAPRLTLAMTAPEWRVSLNSRKAIIGAASTN